MTTVVYGVANAEAELAPTAVKTSAYSAQAQDFVPCDASGGSFTVTMPTAPSDRTQVGVALVHTGGTGTVTIAGGGATFNVDDGPSLLLNQLDQAVILQYVTASNLWWIMSGTLFTGITLTGYIAPAVVALTDGATISVNAAKGNDFRVTLGGSRTLASPTNPVDGQRIDVQVTQDGTGSRTLSYGAAYEFASSLPAPALSTAPGVTDILSFIYNAAKGKWLFTGSVTGYA